MYENDNLFRYGDVIGVEPMKTGNDLEVHFQVRTSTQVLLPADTVHGALQVDIEEFSNALHLDQDQVSIESGYNSLTKIDPSMA